MHDALYSVFVSSLSCACTGWVCLMPGQRYGDIDDLAWRWVTSMVHFVQTAEKNEKQQLFPMQHLTKFEHRPLVVYYLMTGHHQHSRGWRTVSSACIVSSPLSASIHAGQTTLSEPIAHAVWTHKVTSWSLTWTVRYPAAGWHPYRQQHGQHPHEQWPSQPVRLCLFGRVNRCSRALQLRDTGAAMSSVAEWTAVSASSCCPRCRQRPASFTTSITNCPARCQRKVVGT